MSDFFNLNRAFSLKDLEEVLNTLEQQLYPDPRIPGERVLGVSPDTESNRAYVGPAIRPPLPKGIAVRDFGITTAESAVEAAIDSIEQDLTNSLVCRSWGQAWVGGKMRWVALFDRVPKVAATPPPSLTHNIKDRIPWQQSQLSSRFFKGLAQNGLRGFPGTGGQITVVTAVTDADIDTDGPGGGKAKDPWWSKNTSLRWPGGDSCDSRTFRGVVIPPAMSELYNIQKGDVAMVCHRDKCIAAQVYDFGPAEKIGEISFGLAVDLGIYPDRKVDTERSAATKGNIVNDLLTVFFPDSGSGQALPPSALDDIAEGCLNAWLGGTAPAGPAIAVAAPAGEFEALIDKLGTLNFSAGELLVNTKRGSNSEPPQSLWHNILPTLTVLQALREQLGPIHINSGYRNASYNASVGGVSRSQHMDFRALDFSASGHSPSEVAEAAVRLRGQKFFVPVPNLTITEQHAPLHLAGLQLTQGQQGGVNGTFFTFSGGIAAYPSFVHIDCRGENANWG